MENTNQLMDDTMTVNDVEFRVIKLLGKGKGGYSYKVVYTDMSKGSNHEYV